MFNYPRMIYLDLLNSLPPFKFLYAIEFLYWFKPSLVCFNLYLQLQQLLITLLMNIKLQECGKQLVTVVYDWS